MSTVLQPGATVRSDGTLPSTPRTVRWGRLPTGGDPFVAAVRPGEPLVVDTVSHEGLLEDQGRDPVAFFARFGVRRDRVLPDAVALAAADLPRDPDADGPHVVTGPVEVLGARVGDLLEIETVALGRRADYGVVSNRHGRGALPGEMPVGPGPVCTFARVEGGRGVIEVPGSGGRSLRFDLRPFLGLVGVCVPAGDRPHSVPPGRHGGNLDVSCLGVGSRLYLRVQVPGAGVYVGDPHYAQGDGEVALTAFEAPLRATLRMRVLPADTVPAAVLDAAPFGQTTRELVPIGLSEDVGDAMRDCVRRALTLLEHRHGLDRATAYAYLSAATDFSVSQVVDRVSGVHARIRRADLAELVDRWAAWPGVS